MITPQNQALRLPLRREIRVEFGPVQEFAPLVRHAELVRAEAAIVRLGLPLIARWRRNLRYSFTPGYLTALNPKLLVAA